MAKKKSSPDRTLSDCWCPPASPISEGVGEPVECITSTFEFDAPFFETELLPRFLGLRFDHTENDVTFLVEREEKLAQVSAAVLVDIHKVSPQQTTLRWDQIPIAVPGSSSIQHSKVTLLAWERWVRLIVGSANLTPSGYRRNREVFATLDFHDNADSVPRQTALDAIQLLDEILAWSRVPDETRERTRKSLIRVRSQLNGWADMPADFRPRERPKVRFIITRPALSGGAGKSSLESMKALWDGRRVQELRVVTPFVGKSGNGTGNGGDPVVESLSTSTQRRQRTTSRPFWPTP